MKIEVSQLHVHRTKVITVIIEKTDRVDSVIVKEGFKMFRTS